MVETLSRVAALVLSSSFALMSMVSLESSQQVANAGATNSAQAERQRLRSASSPTVTVTGCVDNGGEAGHYMLTSARVSGDSAKSRTGASANKGPLTSTY